MAAARKVDAKTGSRFAGSAVTGGGDAASKTFKIARDVLMKKSMLPLQFMPQDDDGVDRFVGPTVAITYICRFCQLSGAHKAIYCPYRELERKHSMALGGLGDNIDDHPDDNVALDHSEIMGGAPGVVVGMPISEAHDLRTVTSARTGFISGTNGISNSNNNNSNISGVMAGSIVVKAAGSTVAGGSTVHDLRGTRLTTSLPSTNVFAGKREPMPQLLPPILPTPVPVTPTSSASAPISSVTAISSQPEITTHELLDRIDELRRRNEELTTLLSQKTLELEEQMRSNIILRQHLLSTSTSSPAYYSTSSSLTAPAASLPPPPTYEPYNPHDVGAPKRSSYLDTLDDRLEGYGGNNSLYDTNGYGSTSSTDWLSSATHLSIDKRLDPEPSSYYRLSQASSLVPTASVLETSYDDLSMSGAISSATWNDRNRYGGGESTLSSSALDRERRSDRESYSGSRRSPSPIRSRDRSLEHKRSRSPSPSVSRRYKREREPAMPGLSVSTGYSGYADDKLRTVEEPHLPMQAQYLPPPPHTSVPSGSHFGFSRGNLPGSAQSPGHREVVDELHAPRPTSGTRSTTAPPAAVETDQSSGGGGADAMGYLSRPCLFCGGQHHESPHCTFEKFVGRYVQRFHLLV